MNLAPPSDLRWAVRVYQIRWLILFWNCMAQQVSAP